MAIFENFDLLISLFALLPVLIFIWRLLCKKTALPTDWPVVGMLPGLLYNSHRIHGFITDILTESGGTFLLKGPWFGNLDMLLTCDPANIHHIFSRNFSNYPKGPEFRKIFDILGDGIFNADFEQWEFHRRTTMSFMTQDKFYHLLEKAVWEKIKFGLLPVLENFYKRGSSVDLQDVLQRFTFDTICKLVLDHDPKSLSEELPYVACEKAFNDTVEALLYRHLLPESFWKLQKWLQIGKEKKLTKAWRNFDEFIYECIIQKEESESSDQLSLLTWFKSAYEENNKNNKKSSSRAATRVFLRDTALSLLFAGRDTMSACLTWFFWLISKNPGADVRIREEIDRELGVQQQGGKWREFTAAETRRLVYLHGALCESLRLFPPVALEHKAPAQPDVLPTGNHLDSDARVILSFYSTGRMESVWGKDCLEFKPERWMDGKGGIKHVPSYKFPAFNAGARTCLGKEMSFIEMKMVATAVLLHYDIDHHQALDDDDEVIVSPRDSIILHTKHGLRVRLSKRTTDA